MNESTQVPRKEWESDLDWLARNVHVWPAGDHQPWCYVYMVAGGAMKASGNFLDAVAKPTMITIDQWLARRAELQSKPSWEDAQEWATHLAQAANGCWFFLGGESVFLRTNDIHEQVWSAKQAETRKWKGEVLGDWRDTLENRPEQTISDICSEIKDENRHEEIFEPLVSVEDAATSKQPAITPSKYTKTIHGVSVDVYDVLQAWGVSNPALQHLIKKALQCGQRGHKDNAQDLQDIIDSAIRAKELES
ncbi:MAG: hypothetical protein ACRDBQ_22065 [Shewanella sp.]